MFEMDLRNRETRFLIQKRCWECDVRAEPVGDITGFSYVVYILGVLCVTNLLVCSKEYVIV